MSSPITLGNQVANHIYDEIASILKRYPEVPQIKLAVVQIGDDEASTIYIRNKRLACEKLGFGFELCKFKYDVAEVEVMEMLKRLNDDRTITGYIVQLPIPPHLNKFNILNGIDPVKDVDCLHTENIARLYFGYKSARYIPATAFGVFSFIKFFGIETRGKTCVIIGKSNIVGKPLQLVMADEANGGLGCTTIFCDKFTKDLASFTKQADILIVSAGKHHLINKPDMVKDGVIIIDVGIHRVKLGDKFRIQGDVDYDAVKDKCKIITPVPGGIGITTVSSLMFNLVKAYQIQNSK